MTLNATHIITCIAAYLLGSIPSSVWIGKAFFGIDVREHGSGNAGATNTLRTLGKRAGITVLVIDYLKGFAAASLVLLDPAYERGTSAFLNYQMLLGAIAVLGHIYPVFARFKGGKGIATLIGVVTAMDYKLALLCFATFLVIVLITRFISLGSMIAAILSPVFVMLLHGKNHISFIYFCIALAAAVIYTHRSNVKRLLAGNENRFSFSKKESPQPKET